MPMVALSIVLYQPKPDELLPVLRSCAASRAMLSAVFIVDNSPDQGIRGLIESFGFIYFHRPDNPGFGAGHNMAFQQAGSESKYFFVVNPDIEFQPGTLEAMLRYMEQHPNVGAIGPRVTYPDGSLQYNRTLLPTPLNLVLRRFFPNSPATRRMNEDFELRRLSSQRAAEVPALTGCFLLMRAPLIRHLGGFDERFFMYFEDYDLCRRIRQKMQLVYFPEVSVMHEHARASHRNRRLMLAIFSSGMKYFNKWGWVFDRERGRINRGTVEAVSAGSGAPAGSP